MIDVSIVIICMNNLEFLFPCLDSIKRHTSVSYETFVVAYLFSEQNLQRLKEKYPWVKIVESNEIRGFSENNNLALRQAKGRYCFVLNDDTILPMPTIDKLITDIDNLPEKVAVISPHIIFPNGNTQYCGRPPFYWYHWILMCLHLWKESNDKQYSNKTGIFQSFNIIGAAFLIKTEIFRSQGWFDERYFFCPEDIALSTELNNQGYKCFADADAYIVHFGGMSGNKSTSPTQSAVMPAGIIGSINYYSKGNKAIRYTLKSFLTLHSLAKIIIYSTKNLFSGQQKPYTHIINGYKNIIKSMFYNDTPKEIFIKYYSMLRKD